MLQQSPPVKCHKLKKNTDLKAWGAAEVQLARSGSFRSVLIPQQEQTRRVSKQSIVSTKTSCRQKFFLCKLI